MVHYKLYSELAACPLMINGRHIEVLVADGR